MPKARILAVDDQRYFRELIEEFLTAEGFEAQTASSGEEALHLLERSAFDIVLTDLVMPGMDGSELVHRVKSRNPEQDIVVVTGVVDVKTAVDAMKLGASDYLLKPFDRRALALCLESILQKRRLQTEHARLLAENIEFMGERRLFERALGLFACVAVQPLAERIVEGLCHETQAQGGVLWASSGTAISSWPPPGGSFASTPSRKSSTRRSFPPSCATSGPARCWRRRTRRAPTRRRPCSSRCAGRAG